MIMARQSKPLQSNGKFHVRQFIVISINWRTRKMPNKRKIENLTDKNKERILHTENKVNETYLLVLLSFMFLCSVFLIDIIFNVKVYSLLFISFIIVLSSAIFLFYKLREAKIRISAIGSVAKF
uniref:Uncharacterized protein n=2 Tax=Streptococcus agalactiae TaxID=1311 RepID=A0A0U2SD97_STRAG|nr:hypothetical protein [Streptococcus agalactiae]